MTEQATASPERGAAGDLLADYGVGKSFLASPRGTLLTDGVRGTLAAGSGRDTADSLPHRVADLAAAEPDVPVVGVVPFDRAVPVHLFVPDAIRRAAALPSRVVARPTRRHAGWDVRYEPERARYATAVVEALRSLDSGDLRKVVLARAVDVSLPGGVDVPAVLEMLAASDPAGYAFAVDLPSCAGAARTFLGASPELLVERTDNRVTARQCAGSAARSNDHREGRERALALMRSGKDRHEHALVVADVTRRLRRFCRDLSMPPGPAVVQTASTWHLATHVEGVLADPATTSLDVACALHPTPAACGEPVDLARAAIAELEPFDRGYYVGMVGWQDVTATGSGSSPSVAARSRAT